MVNTAKALLTAENTKVNTHISIIKDFDELFVASGKFKLDQSFEKMVLQLKSECAYRSFCKAYLKDAEEFLANVEAYRKLELTNV